jgi:hypothetical protein
MSLPKWLEVLEQVGPGVLKFTPLAPIAPQVIAAIGETQGMPGATGPEKLAHVVNIATQAAQAANAEAGRVVIDPGAMQTTAETAISTVVQVTKMVEAAHENPTASAPVAVIAPTPATT